MKRYICERSLVIFVGTLFDREFMIMLVNVSIAKSIESVVSGFGRLDIWDSMMCRYFFQSALE